MISSALTLRLAQPRDALAIALMSRDLVEQGLEWSYRAARIRRLIADPDTLVLVAWQQGLAGFAVMQFLDERAHLALMAVRPESQRRGVGRQMLQWLLKSAAAAGIASLHLELRADNRTAMAFYRALGFSATVRVQGYYQGREAAIRMLRLLRPPAEPPADWQALMVRRLRPD